MDSQNTNFLTFDQAEEIYRKLRQILPYSRDRELAFPIHQILIYGTSSEYLKDMCRNVAHSSNLTFVGGLVTPKILESTGMIFISDLVGDDFEIAKFRGYISDIKHGPRNWVLGSKMSPYVDELRYFNYTLSKK